MFGPKHVIHFSNRCLALSTIDVNGLLITWICWMCLDFWSISGWRLRWKNARARITIIYFRNILCYVGRFGDIVTPILTMIPARSEVVLYTETTVTWPRTGYDQLLADGFRITIYNRLSGWWFQPLWKIWNSIGMMTYPIYGKIKNVPNHQPE